MLKRTLTFHSHQVNTCQFFEVRDRFHVPPIETTMVSCIFNLEVRYTQDPEMCLPGCNSRVNCKLYKESYIHHVKICTGDLSKTTLKKVMTFIKTLYFSEFLKHHSYIPHFRVFMLINSVSVGLGCLTLFCNVMFFIKSVNYPCTLQRYARIYDPSCFIDYFGFYERNYYNGNPTERFMSCVFVLGLFGLYCFCLSRMSMVWFGNSKAS